MHRRAAGIRRPMEEPVLRGLGAEEVEGVEGVEAGGGGGARSGLKKTKRRGNHRGDGLGGA